MPYIVLFVSKLYHNASGNLECYRTQKKVYFISEDLFVWFHKIPITQHGRNQKFPGGRGSGEESEEKQNYKIGIVWKKIGNSRGMGGYFSKFPPWWSMDMFSGIACCSVNGQDELSVQANLSTFIFLFPQLKPLPTQHVSTQILTRTLMR